MFIAANKIRNDVSQVVYNAARGFETWPGKWQLFYRALSATILV